MCLTNSALLEFSGTSDGRFCRKGVGLTSDTNWVFYTKKVSQSGNMADPYVNEHKDCCLPHFARLFFGPEKFKRTIVFSFQFHGYTLAMRKWWKRLRILLGLFLLLLALLAVFLVFEHFRGRIALASYKRMLAARGEKLSPAEFTSTTTNSENGAPELFAAI